MRVWGPVIILGALFVSGVASLINQIVWQRALKIYLAGSETWSAMLVVLVFVAGLGAGAAWMSARVGLLRAPLKGLALVEFALAAINLLIAWILSGHHSAAIYEIERYALALGLSSRLIYTLIAAAILLGPCFLMGTTLPLAAEASQRQLKKNHKKFLSLIFSFNTLGAVLGTFASGYYLLPLLGQNRTLLLSAALSALSGLLLCAINIQPPQSDNAKARATFVGLATNAQRRGVFGFAFALGFLSLAFEMYLLRALTLVHGPLPYTFSAALTAYLLLWSAGLVLSSRLKENMGAYLGLSALLVVLSTVIAELARWKFAQQLNVLTTAFLLASPCLGFGILYGQSVARIARQWGRDVGRFSFINTAGCCCGILAVTAVGLSFATDFFSVVYCFGLFGTFSCSCAPLQRANISFKGSAVGGNNSGYDGWAGCAQISRSGFARSIWARFFLWARRRRRSHAVPGRGHR